MTPKEHAEVFREAAKTFRALSLEEKDATAQRYWLLMKLCQVLSQSYWKAHNDEVC